MSKKKIDALYDYMESRESEKEKPDPTADSRTEEQQKAGIKILGRMIAEALYNDITATYSKIKKS